MPTRRVRTAAWAAALGTLLAVAAAPRQQGPPRAAETGPAEAAGPAQVVSPVWVVAGEGHGTPAADASTVYFLTRRHELVAVDILSGAERWRASTAGSSHDTVGARVLRVGATVVVGDEGVLGFDRRTGRPLWTMASAPGEFPGAYLGRSIGDDVFAGSASGVVRAIDAGSGRVRWSVPVARTATVFGPIPSPDLVVAGFTESGQPERGGVVALDRETGRERWRHRFPPWVTRRAGTGAAGEPVFVGHLVVAASQDGTVFGLDRVTGVVRWAIPAGLRPDGRGPVLQDFRPIVRVGDVLVIGSLSGQVTGYDLETRRQRWRTAPVSASVAFGLSADEETVYVPYVSGHLVAIDAASGRERWQAGGPAAGLLWPPLVGPGRVLATGTGAALLAFDP